MSKRLDMAMKQAIHIEKLRALGTGGEGEEETWDEGADRARREAGG